MSNTFFSFISRSGGHAIIYWYIAHLSGVTRYDHHWKTTSKITFLKDGKQFKDSRELGEYNQRIYSIENVKKNEKDSLPDITIIRSPDNLFASLFKKASSHRWFIELDELEEVYIDHCRNDCYKIIYDLWYTSESYRRQISHDLGLEFTDQNFQYIPSYAGGSSFDRRDFQNDTMSMNVLNRFEQIPEEELLKFRIKFHRMHFEYELLKKKYDLFS